MPCPNCVAPTTTEMRRRTTLSLSHVPSPRLPAALPLGQNPLVTVLARAALITVAA